MKRRMTEREAWFYLARAWGHVGPSAAFPFCVVAIISGIEAVGLCDSIRSLFRVRLIAAKTLMDMATRRDCHKPPSVGVFWWPLTKAGATERSAFCRRMALLCPNAARKAGVQE